MFEKIESYFQNLHKQVPPSVPICSPVFWRTRRASYGYYKQDQTKKPRTCCALF